MFDEGGLRAEALAAVYALEGFLPRVDPLVDIEEGNVWEPLGTEVTLVLERLRGLVAAPSRHRKHLVTTEQQDVIRLVGSIYLQSAS